MLSFVMWKKLVFMFRAKRQVFVWFSLRAWAQIKMNRSEGKNPSQCYLNRFNFHFEAKYFHSFQSPTAASEHRNFPRTQTCHALPAPNNNDENIIKISLQWKINFHRALSKNTMNFFVKKSSKFALLIWKSTSLCTGKPSLWSFTRIFIMIVHTPWSKHNLALA